MALHSFPLQEAIFSRLNGDSTLGDLITGVFDGVPDDTALPIVVIGPSTTSDDGSKTLDARDYIFNVDVFSDYRGMKETKNILQRVYTLLHEVDVSVSGANLIDLRCEFSSEVLENDGVTRHGVMRFRAFITDS
tara:strand:+ start:381 stop:782 length:402 start_codon:yes stop_codon:yes gene_type:complete